MSNDCADLQGVISQVEDGSFSVNCLQPVTNQKKEKLHENKSAKSSYLHLNQLTVHALLNLLWLLYQLFYEPYVNINVLVQAWAKSSCYTQLILLGVSADSRNHLCFRRDFYFISLLLLYFFPKKSSSIYTWNLLAFDLRNYSLKRHKQYIKWKPVL